MATASRSEGRKGLFATKDTDALVRDTEEKGAVARSASSACST